MDTKEQSTQKLNHLHQMQIWFNGILSGYLNSNTLIYDTFNDKLRKYFFSRDDFGGGSADPQLKKTIQSFFDERKLDKLPELITLLYHDLGNFINKADYGAEYKKITIDNFEYEKVKDLSYKYKAVNKMKENLESVSSFIETCFIHGSFATHDLLEGWSDLDSMLILNDKAFESGNNLCMIRECLHKTNFLFYAADPLAHHFFQITTTLDLDYYPQSFLPLIAYEQGLVLVGDSTLGIRAYDNDAGKLDKLQKLVNRFKNKQKNPSSTISEFKLDLSHLFLLPSFLLQAKGIYVYKKDSFERVKQEYPNLDFSVIDRASELREKWGTPNLFRYYQALLNIFPSGLSDFIFRSYARLVKGRKSGLITPEEQKELIKDTYVLFKDSLETVKN